ncbi:MAG: MFS transporter [Anaerolineae bacterium]|nr:MFS transporter [Anaerolineae bacterium]
MAAQEKAQTLAGLRSLPRNVWVTTTTSFLTDISSEMIIYLIPLFLANVLGASTAIIGLIEGAAEMMSSLLKALSGWLSDRMGNRKRLTVAGYALSALVKPFLYFSGGWQSVFAVRLADRIGKGIRTAPRDALIADSIIPQNRGTAFGLHRAGDTAGAMIGMMIALLIVLATQSQSLTLSRETFQMLVIIAIIPAILGVIVLAVGVKETQRAAADHRAGRSAIPAFSSDFKFFLGVVFLFALGNSSDAFLILRAQERGLSVAGILGMLISFNLVYAVLSGPLGALSDRIGRRRLIISGWLIYGVIYLCFAGAMTAAHMWMIYALYGVYYAAVEGTTKALVADLTLPEQRGTAYGIYHALIGLAALPASLLAGVLWQGIGEWMGFGPSAPFVAGAMLALTASLLLAVRWRGTAQGYLR